MSKQSLDKSKKHRFTRSNMNETTELIYDFLATYINKNGYAPAVRDICNGLGIKSTSTAHSHLKRLVDNGRIVYAKGKRRAIALPTTENTEHSNLDSPKTDTQASNTANTAFDVKTSKATHSNQRRKSSTKILDINKAKEKALDDSQEYDLSFPEDMSRRSFTYVPLIGTVSAGLPILAHEQIEELIPFPDDYFSGSSEVFMLRIQGDSMIDAAILDGDLALVRKQATANLQDIIVALIGDEATVKRLIKKNGRYYLKPENPAYDLIPFNSEECSILGKVTHILRTNVS